MVAMISAVSDAIGMVGVACILLAFYLLNTNKLNALNLSYQCLNLVGSILVLISLCFHVNLASVVIEFAWMLISLLGIYRALRAQKDIEKTPHEVVIPIK